MSPEIAAIFAESKESLNRNNIAFPVITFAVIEIPYRIKNFHN